MTHDIKMKNPRAWLATVFLLLLPMLSQAHRDQWLSWRPDGSLQGLPATYGATRVKMVFSAGGTGLSELAFVSKGRKTSLPSCLLARVKTRSASEVRFSGSWYHDGGLPHYVNIRFPDPDAAPVVGVAPGIEFLFSLKDASLISARRVSVDAAAQTAQYTQIKLIGQEPGRCSEGAPR